MKYFIRFKLRNLTVAGLALIMAATSAVPFFAYPDQLMADTQDDLDAVNKQLEELRNKQSELNASYGELNEKLSASGEKLSSIEDAVNAKQTEIDRSNEDIANMQTEIDQQYAAMKLRIQFMYENNNATILSTLLSAESLSDLLSKSEYIQQISNYDHQKMQELSDLLASLKETQAKLEQEMAELVTLKDDASREADNFAALLSQCQTELDTTSDSITDAEALALEYEKQIEQEMLERQRREMEALEAAKKAQAAQFENYPVMANDVRIEDSKVVENGRYVALLMVGVLTDDNESDPDFTEDVQMAEDAFNAAIEAGK